MMSCQETRQQLSKYADSALDSAERERVRDHLVTCSACRHELAEQGALDMLLKNRFHHEPEPGYFGSFWPTVSQRIDGAPEGERNPPNGGGNRLPQDDEGEGLVFRSSPAMQMLNIPARRAPTGAHQAVIEPPPSHPWRWPLTFMVSTAIVVAGFIYYRQIAVPPPAAEPVALALAPQPTAADETEPEASKDEQPSPAALGEETAGGASESAPAGEGASEGASEGESEGEPDPADERQRRRAAPGRRARADQLGRKPEPDKAASAAPAATGEKVVAKLAAPIELAGKGGGKSGDELDNLIDSAMGTAGGPLPQKPASQQPQADPNQPTQLNIGQIQAGMRKIKGLVQACYDQFQVEGLAKVTVVILPDGTVKDASIKGKFFGTDTGNCVVEAVMKARFDKFSGKPMTIPNYPFRLQ